MVRSGADREEQVASAATGLRALRRDPEDEGPVAPDAREPVSGPRWTVRGLDRRGRAVALLVVLLLLAPFGTALVRANEDGWVPSGDEAHIAVRTLDVFSRNPPLTGQPSTSAQYGDGQFTYHPGPIEFYLMAVPLRVLGSRWGPLLTAAVVNASAVLISLWVVFRRAGPLVGLWAAFLLQATLWSGGTSVLTDTLSSNMTFYSLLATAVLAFAVLDGDWRLLPLGALVGSYAMQQHISVGLLMASIVAVVLVALASQLVSLHRRRDERRNDVLRWLLAAVAVGVVCWLPPLIDQAGPGGGNLREILQFASDQDRETVGLDSGIDQALRAIVPPTILADTDHHGDAMAAPLGAGARAVGIALLVALGGIALGLRRRQPTLARLAIVTLVLLVGGVLTGSSVPSGNEASRVNLYRWMWSAAVLSWLALGWAAALLVRQVLERRSWAAARPTASGLRTATAAALVGLVALLAVTTAVVDGRDDHNRELLAFAVERAAGAEVLEHVDRDRPVLVLSSGLAALWTVAPHIRFRLADAGVPLRVSRSDAPWWGTHRRFRGEPLGAAMVVRSGDGPLGDAPGRKVYEAAFNPEVASLQDDLTRSVKGAEVRTAPGLEAALSEHPEPARALLLGGVGILGTDASHGLLGNRALLELIDQDLIRWPGLDRSKARRLLEILPDRRTVAGDDRFEIRVLTPEELEAAERSLLT